MPLVKRSTIIKKTIQYPSQASLGVKGRVCALDFGGMSCSDGVLVCVDEDVTVERSSSKDEDEASGAGIER